jgi:hypothetical protein
MRLRERQDEEKPLGGCGAGYLRGAEREEFFLHGRVFE